MKSLLAAVDFSDASHPIIAQAQQLAQALDARIHFVHVIEPVSTYVPIGAAMDVLETTPPAILESDTSGQEKRLQKFVEDAQRLGLTADATVTTGLPADEIIHVAETNSSECIVLGSHGHGALYNLFAGSVVTGVLKRATVPVLVVPVANAAKH